MAATIKVESNQVPKVLNTQVTSKPRRSINLVGKLSLPVKAEKDSPLAQTFKSGAERLAERYQKLRLAKQADKQAKPVNQPFYVDVKQNIYSILADDEEHASSVGYNLSVALTIGQEEDYDIGGFSLPSITTSDKLVDEYVSTITSRISNNDLKENFFQDRSEFGKIGRLCMQTMAADYWTKLLGFDPLVPSQSLDVSKKEGESRQTFKARRAEFLRRPIIRFPRLLALEIKNSLTHEKSEAHANALVHMMRVAIDRNSHSDWMLQFILKNPKLIPTMFELQRLGKVPDVAIKEFKNLFHPGEWRSVILSSVYKAEESIKDLLKTKIRDDNELLSLLKRIEGIREEVRLDPVSNEALRLKKIRLGFATRWRKTLPREVILDVLKETPKHLNEEKVIETFSPFTLAASAGIRGSDTASSRLHYNRDNHTYQWAQPIDGQNTSPEVENLGMEYCVFLNG
jgi:hypothetical protein